MMCHQGSIRENLEHLKPFIIIEDLDQETLFLCTSVLFPSSVSSEALMTVNLAPQGVVQSRQVDYELLPDEEQQCCKCRTTCYLSGITCACSPGKMVCLYHAQDLCSCPHRNLTLKWVFSNHSNGSHTVCFLPLLSAKGYVDQGFQECCPKRNYVVIFE